MSQQHPSDVPPQEGDKELSDKERAKEAAGTLLKLAGRGLKAAGKATAHAAVAGAHMVAEKVEENKQRRREEEEREHGEERDVQPLSDGTIPPPLEAFTGDSAPPPLSTWQHQEPEQPERVHRDAPPSYSAAPSNDVEAQSRPLAGVAPQPCSPYWRYTSPPGSFRRLGEVVSRRQPRVGNTLLNTSDLYQRDPAPVPIRRPLPAQPVDDKHYYSPTLTTLGIRDAVFMCVMKVKEDKGWVREDGSYKMRMDQAMRCGICCLPVGLFFLIERILEGVLCLLLLGLGNFFVCLLLMPATLYSFWRVIICTSPRFGPVLKFFMAILYFIPWLLSPVFVLLWSVVIGLTLPFWNHPFHAVQMSALAVAEYFKYGQEFKVNHVFGDYITEGPYYELKFFHFIFAVIFSIVAAVVDGPSFLVLATLNLPRILCVFMLWIWRHSSRECFCCTAPLRIVVSLLSVVFGIVMLPFTFIWGFVDGLVTVASVTWDRGPIEGFKAIGGVPANFALAMDEWVSKAVDPTYEIEVSELDMSMQQRTSKITAYITVCVVALLEITVVVFVILWQTNVVKLP